MEASEAVATRFLANLRDGYERLLDFPLSGPARPLLGPDLRVLLFGNYASYYSVVRWDVVIVRVLHGARDAVALAASGGFSLRRNIP